MQVAPVWQWAKEILSSLNLFRGHARSVWTLDFPENFLRSGELPFWQCPTRTFWLFSPILNTNNTHFQLFAMSFILFWCPVAALPAYASKKVYIYLTSRQSLLPARMAHTILPSLETGGTRIRNWKRRQVFCVFTVHKKKQHLDDAQSILALTMQSDFHAVTHWKSFCNTTESTPPKSLRFSIGVWPPDTGNFNPCVHLVFTLQAWHCFAPDLGIICHFLSPLPLR